MAEFQKSLPASIDTERLILGACLTDKTAFLRIAQLLDISDFALAKHRVIYARMTDLHGRGSEIDRITVMQELAKQGQLESVDGLTYLISLDDGLPEIFHLEDYAQLVKEKATLRRLIYAGQSMIDRALMGREEPNEIVAATEATLLELTDKQGRHDGRFYTAHEIIAGYEGGITAFLDPSRRPKGLATGFVKLDEYTSGLQPGEFVILGARPAMGKTAFALNVAQAILRYPLTAVPVAIFSLEMSKEALLTRMACAAARVDTQKFRLGYLNKDERRRLAVAASDLDTSPLYIDETAGISLIEIHARLRRLLAVNEDKLGLVIIDYLQLMTASKAENRNQQVSELSAGIKRLAKEMNVPFLVLSQLSRAPEKRGNNEPQLSDLRESGAIEQDADQVWFIHREEYYKRDREDLKGLADLIIGKQRNGPVGRIKLAFLREFTKFESLAADLDVPDAPSGGEEI